MVTIAWNGPGTVASWASECSSNCTIWVAVCAPRRYGIYTGRGVQARVVGNAMLADNCWLVFQKKKIAGCCHMLTDTPSTATASLASSGRPEWISLQVSVDGFFWRSSIRLVFQKKKVAGCCHMLTHTPSSTATAILASSGRPERTSLQVSVDGFFWRIHAPSFRSFWIARFGAVQLTAGLDSQTSIRPAMQPSSNLVDVWLTVVWVISAFSILWSVSEAGRMTTLVYFCVLFSFAGKIFSKILSVYVFQLNHRY
jgi:hypothetical protein